MALPDWSGSGTREHRERERERERERVGEESRAESGGHAGVGREIGSEKWGAGETWGVGTVEVKAALIVESEGGGGGGIWERCMALAQRARDGRVDGRVEIGEITPDIACAPLRCTQDVALWGVVRDGVGGGVGSRSASPVSSKCDGDDEHEEEQAAAAAFTGTALLDRRVAPLNVHFRRDFRGSCRQILKSTLCNDFV